jgi:hypothetical protein
VELVAEAEVVVAAVVPTHLELEVVVLVELVDQFHPCLISLRSFLVPHIQLLLVLVELVELVELVQLRQQLVRPVLLVQRDLLELPLRLTVL